MAKFEPALEELLKLEGGYSNDPHDPGGETYAGITRRDWPNWDGWKEIDAAKKFAGGYLYHNAHLGSLKISVANFYHANYWRPWFVEIVSQQVASKIFQHYVNMGTPALRMAALAAHSPDIIHVNDMAPALFLVEYVEELEQYYAKLANDHPHLKKFLFGWLKRAQALPPTDPHEEASSC